MLSLNYRDPRPVYEQVRDELRKLVLSGALAPDSKLPSVRELAGSLAINPNTVQRAYRELEALGLVYTVAGKGAFVAAGEAAVKRRKDELVEELGATVAELAMIGVPQTELLQLVETLYANGGQR